VQFAHLQAIAIGDPHTRLRPQPSPLPLVIDKIV
jgi:hypothetical protein